MILILFLFCSSVFSFIQNPVSVATNKIMILAKSKVDDFVDKNSEYPFPPKFRSKVLHNFHHRSSKILKNDYKLFQQRRKSNRNPKLKTVHGFKIVQKSVSKLQNAWTESLNHELVHSLEKSLEKRSPPLDLIHVIPKVHEPPGVQSHVSICI